MKERTYLAVFESTKTGFSVYFPDFPGCVTVGKNVNEAVKNAQEALNLHYYGMNKDREEIPDPFDIKELSKDDIEGNIVCPITINPERYKRHMEEKRVKINCTIPLWLKREGEQAGLNFSKLLEKAATEELEI